VRTRPRHVGIASQHRVHAALREFCNFEVRKTRRLAFNPVYAVELEPEVTPEARRWSASQANAFLVSTKNDPLGPCSARNILSTLAKAHLIESTSPFAGRWRTHDLLRLCARRLTEIAS
jgi:hypothetical protein